MCKKIHPVGYQALEDNRRKITTQGGRGGDIKDLKLLTTCKTPRGRQGPGHRPRSERRGERTRDTVAEAGTWRGAQRRAVKAVRWWIRAKSR